MQFVMLMQAIVNQMLPLTLAQGVHAYSKMSYLANRKEVVENFQP